MGLANKDDDQANGVQENQEGPDFLNMSDDDIANFDPSSLSQGSNDDIDIIDGADKGDHDQDDGQVAESDEDKAATAAAAAALEDDNKVSDEGEAESTATVDVVTGIADATGKADKTAVDKDGKAITAKTDATGTQEKVEGDGKAKSGDEGAKDESGAVDYEAEYKKLMAPFKANGRDITPKNPEDAIALMQMGANYNKKMAGLKPSMKLLKMLETNGLLDEAQLGFLIDVHKRDPAAINKLIVDSKMDPLDLSADKAGEYKPGNHSVNDQEMELDAVLDDIKDSSSYNQTLKVVSTDWDQASRSEVVKHPQVLKIINGHIESGIFAIIQAEMDSERTFGRLKDLSDIAAYQKVGDAIQARGGFNHLNSGSSQVQGKPTVVTPVIVTPKPTTAEDDKLKDRRKAASGTKAAAPNKGVPADFNPLQMSDADFAKFQI